MNPREEIVKQISSAKRKAIKGVSQLNKLTGITKFTNKRLQKLKYGFIHSQFAYPDGVSIVMNQIEKVMTEDIGVSKDNLFYLIGRSKKRGKNITIRSKLWKKERTNQLMFKNFEKGYGGDMNERIEKAIVKAEKIIEEWVKKNKINIIVAHNTCHPVNFVLSVALYRYYKHALKNKESTPKYILWWHDSHLERKFFQNPASDVEQYLLDGVPGRFVEYIVFINSTQFQNAEKYFLELDKKDKGYFDAMRNNHTVVYNTTDTFIDSYDDLESDKMADRIEKFLEDFKVRQFLRKKRLTLSDVLFCLQHTRIVRRKRIDFALRYCFELLKKKRKTGTHTKALYFLVSGHNADNSKRELLKTYRKLCKEYRTTRVFLIFAEDYDDKTDIKFEEYPIIFAKLRGFATYFSEIEGFGNNLLEVLASGLIPVVYTYPVFIKDIEKYKFKCVALDRFEVDEKSIDEMMDVIRNDRKRKIWVNSNLKILRRSFPHKIIEFKLRRAIIRRRLHK